MLRTALSTVNTQHRVVKGHVNLRVWKLYKLSRKKLKVSCVVLGSISDQIRCVKKHPVSQNKNHLRALCVHTYLTIHRC